MQKPLLLVCLFESITSKSVICIGIRMEKKMTNRAKQAIETKKKIYKTGIKLFKKDGYQNVSVEQIAKAAGVGIGTFYHYYESKIQLFTEIFIHAEDYFEEFEHVDLKEQNPYELFQRYFYQYACLNESAGLEFAQQLTSYENRKFLEGNQDFEQKVTEMIRFYQEEEKMDKGQSAECICDLFFITARGVLFDWSINNGEYILTDKMAFVMEQVLKSYHIFR